MNGVSYIQRVAIKGGVAPMTDCSAANKGKREIVKYQADYIFGQPIKPTIQSRLFARKSSTLLRWNSSPMAGVFTTC